MLAVKEDEDEHEDDFYQFRMYERDRTGVVSQLVERKTKVVSQLVEAGAALDLQDKVTRSNIIHYFIYLACLAETDITMVVIALD